MPFMRATAEKIAKAIPGAQRQVVEGQAHDVDAKVLAPILLKFFKQPPLRRPQSSRSARVVPFSCSTKPRTLPLGDRSNSTSHLTRSQAKRSGRPATG